MNTILITGGAGFIGSKLGTKLIAQGHRVRVLDSLSEQIHGPHATMPPWTDHPLVETVTGSVTDYAIWKASLAGVNAVAHLAAETGTGQSMYEIARYNEVNSQGTALLLDILAQTPGHGVDRVVLTSSRSVYGEGRYECRACGNAPVYPQARSSAQLQTAAWEPQCPRCNAAMGAAPTREDDLTSPASIYAATKLAQEDMVRIACGALGIGFAILRLQNVYGEGQSLKNPYTGILSIFSTKVRRGAELPLFEDGEESRDFVHVDDVAEVLVRCLLRPGAPDAIINVGSGVSTSVSEVARKLNVALGGSSRLKVTGEYRLGDIRHNVADVSRLAQLFDYRPRVLLDEGLGRFARWVLSEELPEDQLERANAELRARKLMV